MMQVLSPITIIHSNFLLILNMFVSQQKRQPTDNSVYESDIRTRQEYGNYK